MYCPMGCIWAMKFTHNNFQSLLHNIYKCHNNMFTYNNFIRISTMPVSDMLKQSNDVCNVTVDVFYRQNWHCVHRMPIATLHIILQWRSSITKALMPFQNLCPLLSACLFYLFKPLNRQIAALAAKLCNSMGFLWFKWCYKVTGS